MTKDEIRKLVSTGRDVKSGKATMPNTGQVIQLGFIGPEKLRIEFYTNEIDTNSVVQMIYNILQRPASFRSTVYAEAYKKYHHDVEWIGCNSPEEAIRNGEFSPHTPPKSAEDMVSLISFFSIWAAKGWKSKKPYINIRGDAAWDNENGIALFFENGEQYVKTGTLNDNLDAF